MVDVILKVFGSNQVNSFSIQAHLIFICICLVFLYFKWKELNFESYPIERTAQQFKDSVLAAANKMKWRVKVLSDNSAIATTHDYWSSTGGHKVEIYREKGKLLINSRILAYRLGSGPDIFSANRKIKSTFIDIYFRSNKGENILKVINKEIKDAEIAIENEPEWTVKNILKRIIAYLFCFAFMTIAYLIFEHDGFHIIALFLGLLGLSYILLDIYVILKKQLKKHS